MKMNDLTQAQIEEQFSRTNITAMIEYETESFIDILDEEDAKNIARVLGTIDIQDILHRLIFLLFNPRMGERVKMETKVVDIANPYYDELLSPVETTQEEVTAYFPLSKKNKLYHEDQGTIHNFKRMIELNSIATTLFKSEYMLSLFPIDDDRGAKVAELIGLLDGKFYDIEKAKVRVKKYDDTGFIYEYIDAIIVSYDMSLSEDMYPLEFYRFPLKETPKNWSVGESGGYHTIMQQSTLNGGLDDQPQECLDVLNTLQHNAFILRENISLEEYSEYLFDKAYDKIQGMDHVFKERLAKRIVDGQIGTFALTLDFVEDNSFYFEWKFDSRGRLYNSGYNIHLQADKYKKGMLLPSPTNFKEK